jgi:GAF domain-containing protein
LRVASREGGRKGLGGDAGSHALRRQEALIDLQRRLLRSRGKKRMLAEAVRCLTQELSVPLAEVLELSSEGERLEFAAGSGFEAVEGTGAGTGLASQAAYTLISKHPVVVEDIGAEVRFEACELFRRAGVASGITVKVHRGDALYGVIGAHDREPRAFAPEEAGFLQDVAEALGFALEGAYEVEDRKREIEVERRLRREHMDDRDLISRASAAHAACRTAEGALKTAARLAAGSLLGDWCFVDVLEEPEGPGCEPMVVRAAVAGPVKDPGQRRLAEELGRRCLPLDPSVGYGAHRVLATGQPNIVPHLSDKHLVAAAPSEEALGQMRAISPRSYLGVPLRAGGRLVGALGIVSVRKERCSAERRIGLALDLAHAVALFVERHRKEALEEVGARGRATLVESRPDRGTRRDVPPITPRQRQVLRLMEDGLSDAAIGARLHLSVKTVNSHAHRLYRLLGASSRTEAVSLARRLDLL